MMAEAVNETKEIPSGSPEQDTAVQPVLQPDSSEIPLGGISIDPAELKSTDIHAATNSETTDMQGTGEQPEPPVVTVKTEAEMMAEQAERHSTIVDRHPGSVAEPYTMKIVRHHKPLPENLVIQSADWKPVLITEEMQKDHPELRYETYMPSHADDPRLLVNRPGAWVDEPRNELHFARVAEQVVPAITESIDGKFLIVGNGTDALSISKEPSDVDGRKVWPVYAGGEVYGRLERGKSRGMKGLLSKEYVLYQGYSEFEKDTLNQQIVMKFLAVPNGVFRTEMSEALPYSPADRAGFVRAVRMLDREKPTVKTFGKAFSEDAVDAFKTAKTAVTSFLTGLVKRFKPQA